MSQRLRHFRITTSFFIFFFPAWTMQSNPIYYLGVGFLVIFEKRRDKLIDTGPSLSEIFPLPYLPTRIFDFRRIAIPKVAKFFAFFRRRNKRFSVSCIKMPVPGRYSKFFISHFWVYTYRVGFSRPMSNGQSQNAA